MTNKEQLSALMDNALNNKQALESLLSGDDNLQTWGNYHKIGDRLRGDTALVPQDLDIVSNIAFALEQEPTYSADHADKVNDTDKANNAESVSPMLEAQPTPDKARRQMPSWLNNLVQVGMAACVTLVVVLGMQQWNQSGEGSAISSDVPVLQTVPVAGVAEPVSLTRDSLEQQRTSVSNQQEQKAQLIEEHRRVNALMQDYDLQRRLNTTDQ